MRAALLAVIQLLLAVVSSPAQTYDVVVYGATSAGVAAAVAAARDGASVVLVEPGRFIGGMAAAGAATPQVGTEKAIGGLALEFYQRAGKLRESNLAWGVEPHVATSVFRGMLAGAGVTVSMESRLREGSAVKKRKRRIQRVVTENGKIFRGAIFLDCSYEGDLMAEAGIPFTAGRGEGVAVEGNYSFALCLDLDVRNQVPLPRPANYDPQRYNPSADAILALAAKRAPEMGDLLHLIPLPGGKASVIAEIGSAGEDYLAGDERQRAEIWQAHMDYTAGFFYFLANDERLPEAFRAEVSRWGLCADEYAYTNHWPHQMHIREARRMTGESVMSWQDVGESQAGGIGVGYFRGEPFSIPYRVIVPPEGRPRNLLVVLSPAAGAGITDALRKEPLPMILGHAAGVAAKMAAGSGGAVRDVNPPALSRKLAGQGAVVDIP